MGPTHLLHCACGGTREAPIALTILSCVQCGAAMSPESPIVYAPPPSRTLVATATFASQLLGTLAFGLSLVWIIGLHSREPAVLAVLIAGAITVFAGGNAHRGNVIALGICAAFDVAIAVAALARPPVAEAFVWPALARVHVEQQFGVAMLVAGTVAALAAVTCLAALPQARRFSAWRGERLLHAARVVRG